MSKNLDTRYVNVGEEPTTHASEHQHGGGDEVATATAGANALPKAKADGKLDAGWGGIADALASLDGGGRLPTGQLTVHASTHENGGTDEIDVAGLSGVLADAQTPASHASTHENGGADEISVAGLSGALADPQTPASHASSHQNGGADEINVAGLSGALADAQTPTAHASSHQHGGADEIATATAGANAIPKADGTGDLDEEWIPDSIGGYSAEFLTHNGTTPYIPTTSTSYVTVGQFIFPGTTGMRGVLDTVKAIGSAASDSSTSGFRIYDLTNAQTIAEVAAAATNVAEAIINLGTISNLPAVEAVFEIQFKRTTGGAARIHFVNLYKA